MKGMKMQRFIGENPQVNNLEKFLCALHTPLPPVSSCRLGFNTFLVSLVSAVGE